LLRQGEKAEQSFLPLVGVCHYKYFAAFKTSQDSALAFLSVLEISDQAESSREAS